jgi:1-acyl-sn-glycerol-3-phosphate acyltransferase
MFSSCWIVKNWLVVMSGTSLTKTESRLLGSLRLVLRASFLAVHMLGGIITELLLVLCMGPRWFDRNFGRWIVRKWMQVLNHILGLDIEQCGQPAASLMAANHVSWLDVMAINALTETRFLSKADVKHWPVIGVLVTLCGTLYLERGSLSSLRRLNHSLEELLARQRSIVIYPEGTTTDGSKVLPFHGGLFQAALNRQARVQPVAIRYHENGELDQEAPYIGDDVFFPHLLRILRRPCTRVTVSFLPAVSVTNRNRQELAVMCRQAVVAELDRLAAVNVPARRMEVVLSWTLP